MKQLIITLVASFSLSFPALAAPAMFKAKAKQAETFPTSPVVERKVKFWESIFTRYSSDELVIHDLKQPDLVIGTIPYIKGKGQRIASYPKIYDEALADFASQGEKAKRLSALHKKIWSVYRKDDQAKSRLISGRVELRTQLGLADVFQQAAMRAQKYLPRMERIFAEHQLPVELTRLPFVESMFQTGAMSKVGAAGLWQLMPSAAKPHIVVNGRKDERALPLKATYAAAQIMKANYKKLKSWPLAITAYNHGANGVARGVQKTGSDNLADLILSYESRSFGFASKNFYAEFLAAKRSYAKWEVAQKSKNRSKSKQVAMAD